MGWAPVMAYWFATRVLYVGLARILVESGLVFLRGPITAQAFTWHLFGILGMGPASAVSVGLTFSSFCDAKTFAMTPLSHVPRLGMAMAGSFLGGRRPSSRLSSTRAITCLEAITSDRTAMVRRGVFRLRPCGV